MSYRRQPIIPGQIYHVFNKSIGGSTIFTDKKDCQRFINVVDYYRFTSPELRFSFFNRLPVSERNNYIDKLRKGKKLVTIYAYCLMPNHFHFLLKELSEGGVIKFTSNLQNSYAKYYNTKNDRQGSLFQEMFKTVRIDTDEQLLHVARYIHLNPYSSFVVRKLTDINNYTWSSYNTYLGKNNFDFIDKDFLLSFYPAPKKLELFTLDQANYQKRLKEIEHLIIE